MMSTSQHSAAAAAPEDEVAAWLLKRRHEELGMMFRAAWDNYIKFYTVFLTFNVAAMGWLLTHDPKIVIPKSIYQVLAVVFIVQSILTAITSGSLAIYSRRVGVEHTRVERDILGAVASPAALIGTRAIPVEFAMWAGWANAGAMVGMSCAWAYIGF
jgi:hypothetical protein